MVINFNLNGQPQTVEVAPDTPILWVVREQFKLVGSKFGCGAGFCGACTMHVNGQAVRACVHPVEKVNGKSVTTIEGLGTPDQLHPIQAEWVARSVPQCGYCQSGQIMTAAALLNDNPNPSVTEVEQAMAGNICRCGCYVRIKDAVLAASKRMRRLASASGTFYEAEPLTDAATVQEAAS